MSIELSAGWEYDAINEPKTKGMMHLDDYDGAVFYKTEIEKLINETDDTDTLDLVYKILLCAKK